MELIYSIDNKIELDWSSIYIYIVQENNPPIHIITTVHCTTYIFVNNRTHRRTCMQLTKFHFSIQHYYYYYYYFFSTMGSICRSLSFIVRMYIYIYMLSCPDDVSNTYVFPSWTPPLLGAGTETSSCWSWNLKI